MAARGASAAARARAADWISRRSCAAGFIGAKFYGGLLRGLRELGYVEGRDVVVRETRAGRFQQEIKAGRHRLLADEPIQAGGLDSGLSPYDLVLAGLGACTSMTLRLYAERKALPLDRVTVRLAHSRIHAADCENCETKEGMLDRIDRGITMAGNLDEDQRKRLLEIADKCPVHRTLTSEIDIRTVERREES